MPDSVVAGQSDLTTAAAPTSRSKYLGFGFPPASGGAINEAAFGGWLAPRLDATHQHAKGRYPRKQTRLEILAGVKCYTYVMFWRLVLSGGFDGNSDVGSNEKNKAFSIESHVVLSGG